MIEKIKLRGIGNDGITCFCCAEISVDGKFSGGYQPNQTGFVADFAAGMRVRGMFLVCGSNCFLDYRDYEPHRVQVKIGSCKEHLPNLEKLSDLISDGEITIEKIVLARNAAIAEMEKEG